VAAIMDPLSEVLRSVRLVGGVFLDNRFTAPWCVHSRITAEDCKPLLAKPSHVIGYHFILDGEPLLNVADEPATKLRAGEIVLLPRCDPHTLASGPGLKPIPAHTLVQPSADGGLAQIRHGGGGAPTHIVCGFLGSEELYNPLLATLPSVLTLDVNQGASRDWVEASVRYAAGELTQGRIASSGVMSRLSELLFTEAVRNYAATLPEHAAGWLKGVADPHVGRALALIHHKTSEPWSAESLAREVALSRSAFVERFTALVGTPPIRYLTVWRLQIAKLRLRETRQTIAQLAHSVGYESEEAFSRAFKREFGVPPARWREQQTAA
jgi:AraC-like DNA-binding protein